MLPAIIGIMAKYSVPMTSISIRPPSLEDVFIYLTGKKLAGSETGIRKPATGANATMIKGAVAIFKRDFKKFLSNPFIIVMTLVMPIMYLVIFGNAVGGTLTHIPIAVVQEQPFTDYHPPLHCVRQRIWRRLPRGTIPRTFDVNVYSDEEKAKRASEGRAGQGVIVFPSPISRDNAVRLYVDSSDYATPALVESGVQGVLVQAGATNPVQMNKIYGDIKYIQFFGVGVIVMAIFMTTMFGGGIALIKDRELGIIEGYLVTPGKEVEHHHRDDRQRDDPGVSCRVYDFYCRYPDHRYHHPEYGRLLPDPVRPLHNQPWRHQPDGLDRLAVHRAAVILVGCRIFQPYPVYDKRGFLPDDRDA